MVISVGLTEALLDDLLELTVEFPGRFVGRSRSGTERADFLQEALLQDT